MPLHLKCDDEKEMKNKIFHITILVIILLCIKEAACKDIYIRIAYGSIKQFAPFTVTLFGTTDIDMVIPIYDDVKIMGYNDKQLTIKDLQQGQIVEVKYYPQSPSVSSRSRYGKEIRLIHNVSSVKSLLWAQQDMEQTIRFNSAKALISIGIPAIPELISFLRDRNEDLDIRKSAANVLGRIKDVNLTAVEPLIEVINEKYMPFRESVKWALIDKTGQNFEFDQIQWETWWKENKGNYFNLLGNCTKKEPQSIDGEHRCWLKALIAKQATAAVANPPASISMCIYNNQKYYYLPSRCCDMPSILWDDLGNRICSPDGGLTGGGDGKCPKDFLTGKKDWRIIWKDSRYREQQ